MYMFSCDLRSKINLRHFIVMYRFHTFFFYAIYMLMPIFVICKCKIFCFSGVKIDHPCFRKVKDFLKIRISLVTGTSRYQTLITSRYQTLITSHYLTFITSQYITFITSRPLTLITSQYVTLIMFRYLTCIRS